MTLEEGTKIASGVVDALKVRPDLLVFLALILVITFTSYRTRQLTEERHKVMLVELMDRCMEPAKR